MSAITIKNLFYRIKFDREFVPYKRKVHWISIAEIRAYEDEHGSFISIDFLGVPPDANGQPDSQAKLNRITTNPEWIDEKLNELIKIHNLTDVQVTLNKEEPEG